MTVLYEDRISVHYGFIFFDTDADSGDLLVESRDGQANGLLGAKIPHVLSMVTGLHTGDIPLTVEWHPAEPDLQETWDDIVEASIEVPQTEMMLSAFEVFEDIEMPALGWHRARFSGRRMDEGSAMDTPDEDEMAPDSYRLDLWLAPPAPDSIVKVSSEIAQYWHGVATGSPRQQDEVGRPDGPYRDPD